MKKILAILCFALLTASCSNDDVPLFFFEFVPATAVSNVPDRFVVGQADTLQVLYERPTTCYGFEGFDYERDGDIRRVAIVARVIEQRGPCNAIDDDEITIAPLIFKPEEVGTVTFQFFQGNDSDGNPLYLNIDVPIEE